MSGREGTGRDGPRTAPSAGVPEASPIDAPAAGAGPDVVRAPFISVVIPTHQRRELLLRALAALAAQSLPKDRYEVVVVCDGCTDRTADAARAFAEPAPGASGRHAGESWTADAVVASADAAAAGAPAGATSEGVGPAMVAAGASASPTAGATASRPPTSPTRLALTVLEQPNAGAAAARNRGARAARAPLLLFLDDDMIAAPDLLEIHLARHAQTPGAIVIGAVPVDPSSPRSFLTAGLAAWAGRRDARLSAPGAPIPPGDVLTGQISLARTTFEALNGFDPRFTAGGSYGGEDVELGWRARRLDIPIVYEPCAVSHQIFDKMFPALRRDVRHAGAADVRLARLHPEIAPGLMLGQVDTLSPWQRRAVNLTLATPVLASILFAPLLAGLDLAARRHLTGRLLENLHGVARAHIYGLGMRDAGYRPDLP